MQKGLFLRRRNINQPRVAKLPWVTNNNSKYSLKGIYKK
jgi:hypothetical protein